MSENLSNHNEPWDDMPLPNEDEAWQKMNRLLDEEDKRRRLLPFWFWRYGLLSLLLLGTAAGSYFLLTQNGKQPVAGAMNKETDRQQQQSEQTSLQNKKEKDPLPLTPAAEKKKEKAREESEVSQTPVQENTVAAVKEKEDVSAYKIPAGKTGLKLPAKLSGVQPATAVRRKNPVAKQDRFSKQKQTGTSNDVQLENPVNRREKEAGTVAKNGTPATVSVHPNAETKTDSLGVPAGKTGKDSTKAADSAKAIAAPPVVSNETKKKKEKKKNGLSLSLGVGLQQAIALNGQQTSSYNLNGKESSLSDHIPSVFLRLQKGKWFLQGEFQYNIPQPVEPISYSQTTSFNSFSALVNTEKESIQKLYYHQLPVSINFFLLPDWSLGAGGTYNLLSGAVTEKEMESKNVGTGNETFSTHIVPVKGYRDSFLYKSTAGFLLQTDYHWKRFSLGLRYTKNLQSFIKYTRPDGTVQDEKNSLLQAVLRFRIKG